MLNRTDDGVCMDDRMLAADRTMIRYTDGGTQVTVPSLPGRMNLTVLGSGSVVVREARQVTVEEGYVSARLQALTCAKMELLELPSSLREAERGAVFAPQLREILLRRRLSETEFRLLQTGTLPCGGGRRLLNPDLSASLSALAVLKNCQELLGPPLPALQEEMGALLEPEHRMDLRVFEPLPCLNLTGCEPQTDECALVMRMIRRGARGWRHPLAERMSDLRIRTAEAGPRELEKLSVATLEPEHTHRLPDGTYAVSLRITARRLFAPALLKVIWNHQPYYLYSRQHLTEDRACPYWREDMGVFSENEGLITDRKLSEAIYAKVRLLMLL